MEGRPSFKAFPNELNSVVYLKVGQRSVWYNTVMHNCRCHMSSRAPVLTPPFAQNNYLSFPLLVHCHLQSEIVVQKGPYIQGSNGELICIFVVVVVFQHEG